MVAKALIHRNRGVESKALIHKHQRLCDDVIAWWDTLMADVVSLLVVMCVKGGPIKGDVVGDPTSWDVIGMFGKISQVWM